MINVSDQLRARLNRGDCIDLRGYGKAGGGLVLAIQAFGEALTSDPTLAVEDWPLFSSARKGANVCAYLRIAKGSVQDTSRIQQPDIALLMNEAAAEDVDFADGTDHGIYVINTKLTPAEAAKKYRLAGTVVTIDGDSIGMKHLGRTLPNVAVLAALLKATGLVDLADGRASLKHKLEKRRVPKRIIDSNLAMFDDAVSLSATGEFGQNGDTTHKKPVFKGYGELPAGAQSKLRTSVANRTAGYGRPAVRIEFNDPTNKCNGCSLCVGQCPEGIIEFTADPERGAIVHGARFASHCKRCSECVQACPLHLFTEVPLVAPPSTRPEGS